MTSTIARLILAMLLLPATGAVFLLSFVALIRSNGPPSVFRLLVVWFVVYSFVGIYWLALWWRTVRWSAARLGQTVAATVIALGIGVVVAALCSALGRSIPVQIAILIGGGTVPIAWVLGTVMVWQEIPVERAARLAEFGATVVCPICGYNLAGLRSAVCPECGGSFTLDQLAAAQPRANAEQG